MFSTAENLCSFQSFVMKNVVGSCPVHPCLQNGVFVSEEKACLWYTFALSRETAQALFFFFKKKKTKPKIKQNNKKTHNKIHHWYLWARCCCLQQSCISLSQWLVFEAQSPFPFLAGLIVFPASLQTKELLSTEHNIVPRKDSWTSFEKNY